MQYTFVLGLFSWTNDHEQSCYLSHQNIDILFVSCVFVSRSVRGAVWFGFETKNHPNCKIKNMRFDLVRLSFKIQSEQNQCGLGWIDWCGFFETVIFFLFLTIKSS